jgi:hypothetical protein
MKTILGDFNDKVGEVCYLYRTCGGHSLHNGIDDNVEQTVHFAMERDKYVAGTWY